jgi:hypothetical protein
VSDLAEAVDGDAVVLLPPPLATTRGVTSRGLLVEEAPLLPLLLPLLLLLSTGNA